MELYQWVIMIGTPVLAFILTVITAVIGETDKKSESKNNGSSGIGFTGMLTILFVGLKLGDIIAWSWFWVLSPIWITSAVICAILTLGLIALAGLNIFFRLSR